MRAEEFITEYYDKRMSPEDAVYNTAVRWFEKFKNQGDDPYNAAISATKIVDGLSAHKFIDYLKHNALLSEDEINEGLLMEGYIAFTLDKKSRNVLKKTFPPKYDDFIGHHVTYKFGVKPNTPLPKGGTLNVIGYIDDGESLEALVVEVNGKTTRPDGKIYHITWSLDRSKGRKPVHSNNLLASKDYEPVAPISINTKSEML